MSNPSNMQNKDGGFAVPTQQPKRLIFYASKAFMDKVPALADERYKSAIVRLRAKFAEQTNPGRGLNQKGTNTEEDRGTPARWVRGYLVAERLEDTLGKTKEKRRGCADIRQVSGIELNFLTYGSQLRGRLARRQLTVMRQLVKTVNLRPVVLRPLAAGHRGSAFLHSTSVRNRTENPCRKQHGQNQKRCKKAKPHSKNPEYNGLKRDAKSALLIISSSNP